MRIFSVFVLVLSTLGGIHASAVETPSHEQYHQHMAAAASHAFHAMASSALLPGVSTACQTTTDAIMNNTNVQTAAAVIVHGGCSKLNYDDRTICSLTKPSPTSGTMNCNCQANMTNTEAFFTSVQAMGGKACPVSVSMTMSASGSSNGQRVDVIANIQQTLSDYQIFGSQCTSQDIQTALDGVAQMGVDQVTALAGSNNNGVSLNLFNVQVTACDFSATRSGPSTGTSSSTGGGQGTGLGSGAGSLGSGAGSQVGMSWFTVLCVMLASSIMMMRH